MMEPEAADRGPSTDALEAHRDRELVRRLLAAEEAAFDEFCDRHLDPLYRFALARLDHDEELARDMAQQTLVTAFGKLAEFRGESTLLTWLCGICHFAIRNHRRRESRAPRLVALDGPARENRADFRELADPTEGPMASLGRRDLERCVHETLDSLPPHYGDALEWKYLEDLPVVEIARRLGVAPKAAESTLTRARLAFRRAYEALCGATPLAEPGGGGVA